MLILTATLASKPHRPGLAAVVAGLGAAVVVGSEVDIIPVRIVTYVTRPVPAHETRGS
jgi:hypothetical protein